MTQTATKKIIAIVVAVVLVIGLAAGTAIIVSKQVEPASTTIENGLSAYELAVQYGHEGTTQEWLDCQPADLMEYVREENL